MEKIKFNLPERKTNSPNSERAYWVDKICKDLMGGAEFRKINGQMREFTAKEIKDLYEKAVRWEKNPGALAWILIKEKRKEIKSLKK